MKIGFIGCGNMGGALARAVALGDGVSLYLADHSEEKARGLAEELCATPCSNNEIAETCDYIFLGVKPNVIGSVAEGIRGSLSSNKDAVIVTMAAGVGIASLEGILGADRPIIRIMPNTPASVSRGMITWCKNGAVAENAEKAFEALLSPAGMLDKIPESLIDAASAVAGCGPAFVYMFAEALADGGVKCGLPRDKAMTYAVQTLIGAAEMIRKTGKHPGQLKDEVCSPGGSTIEGVHTLEDGAFRSLAANAVISAYEKTKKLGK